MSTNLRIDRVQLEIVIGNDESRKRMAELETDIKKTKNQLALLKKQGKENTEEFKKAELQLKSLQTEYDGLINQIGLTGLSMKELTKRQKELNAIMAAMDPNTKEYKQLQAQLVAVNTRMTELRNGVRATERAQMSLGQRLGGLADKFNKFSALTIGAIGALTGVIFSARKAVDAFNEFESAQDNLQALTGLSEEKVKGLGDAAIEMSTSVQEGGVRITKSAKDIVDAFTSAGSKRPELLANAEALKTVTNDALILAEAAKMELDPAIGAVTAAMNQFGLGAEESRRIINVFAAGSKAGSAEVDSLGASFKNVGTVAAESNMTLEETVAALEVLGEKQIYAEEAGTKLRGALLKLQQAGVGYASGTFNMRDALVEANAQLEKQGTEAQKDALKMKLFGAENITVGSILLGNIQKYDELTKAVTGTNTAIEQAAINTDNNAAKLEQAKNRAQENAIVLGEQLAPALTFSTNAFSYLLKVLVSIIKNWDTFKKYLYTATAALASYIVLVTVAEFKTSKLSKAVEFLKKTFQSLNAAMNKNPWLAVAAGVFALGVAIYQFTKQATKAQLAQKVLNDVMTEARKNIAKERTEIEALMLVAKDETASKETREKAIRRMNEISPEYLGNLTLESINTVEATKSVEKYIKALEKKAAIMAAEEKLVELNKQILDEQAKSFDDSVGFIEDAFNRALSAGNTALYLGATATSAIENTQNAIEKLNAQKERLIKFLSEENQLVNINTDATNENTGSITDNTTATNANAQAKADDSRMLFELTRQLNVEAIEDERKRAEEELEIWYTTSQEKILMATASDAQKKYALEQLDAAYTAKRLENEQKFQDELQKRYEGIAEFVTEAQRGIVTEQEKLNEIELSAIDAKYQKQIDAATKFAEEDIARREEYLRLITELETVRDEEKKLYLEAKEREHAEKIASIREQYGLVTNEEKLADELELLQKHFEEKLLTEEQYEKARNLIKKKYAQIASDEEMQRRSENLSQMSAVISASEALTNAAKERELQRVGEDEEKKKQIQKKYADIEFAITLAQIAATAAKAYMEAAALAIVNPFAGAAAYIALAAQAGASVLAATTQRNAVMQLAEGKYDVVGEDDGKHYRAPLVESLGTGIVRKPTLVAEEPEMVVDHKTLYNPKTDRYGMTVMDHARAISSMRAVRVPQRARGKMPNSINNQNAVNSDMSEMLAVMKMQTEELQRMRGDLQNFKGKLKAQIVYTDLEDYEAKINKVRNDTSVS